MATQNDLYTTTISLNVDKDSGDSPGNRHSTVLTYKHMDYGDVVAIEALVSNTLLPALINAGFVAAEAAGISVPNLSTSSDKKVK